MTDHAILYTFLPEGYRIDYVMPFGHSSGRTFLYINGTHNGRRTPASIDMEDYDRRAESLATARWLDAVEQGAE